MGPFIEKLKQVGFEGEVDDSQATRQAYSHDASLFEIMPQLVVYPKSEADLQKLVAGAVQLKKQMPNLSLTARSAGTCMSGGAINDSVIVDFRRYLTAIESVDELSAKVQPGALYREFEAATLRHGALLPSFPASRELATVGGMVANDAGGEKSLEFGKTENFVEQLRVVLGDGQPHLLKALNRQELEAKMSAGDFESQLCQQLFKLIEANYDRIKAAKPRVSKNSTGYNLWDVWDRQSGVFDLTKLFVGSQGTLGLISDIKFRLVHDKPHSGVLVVFMKNLNGLGELINTVVAAKPASFEAFDNHTLTTAIKFFPYFHKNLGWNGLIKLGFQLLPDALLLFKGIPKMVLLIEFTGRTPQEVKTQVHAMKLALGPYKLEATEEDNTEAKAWKFRIMRRESFNLLRQKVKDKHTAPFIDDLVVPPQHLVEFLPRLQAIIKKYDLLATIAGHMGDGNFHVIPLMKIEDPKERAKLAPAMREVNQLVLSYGGSLSGEHNDGLIRGPWLEQMYGPEIVKLFREVKRIFDPQNIFNPHKKTDANWQYSMDHVRQKF
ncbi:FAD-binding oxidoreductase [Candidatus Saccharibacteria bacterium]|nr:FAD-binding oxidoreductase [Candidatus Saccharibacteria bacterium]